MVAQKYDLPVDELWADDCLGFSVRAADLAFRHLRAQLCIPSLTFEPLCFDKFRIGEVGGAPIYVVLFGRGRNCIWSPLVIRIHIVVDQRG